MPSRWSISQAVSVVVLPFFAVGPIVTSLELVFGFLPQHLPAVQNLHSAGSVGLALWFGSILFGVLALFSQFRSGPVLRLLAAASFVAVYVAGATQVWRHFTWGCWIAVGFLVLAVADAAFRRKT